MLSINSSEIWLHGCTPRQNRAALQQLGFDTATLERQFPSQRGGLPSDDPQALADPFDFSAPRYWAAFVLIGDPG